MSIKQAAFIAAVILTLSPAFGQRRRSGRVGNGGTAPLTSDITQSATATFQGTLRNFDKKTFVVELDDNQTLVFRRGKRTELRPSGIQLNVRVQVDARKDATGDLDAVRVCEKSCSGAKSQ